MARFQDLIKCCQLSFIQFSNKIVMKPYLNTPRHKELKNSFNINSQYINDENEDEKIQSLDISKVYFKSMHYNKTQKSKMDDSIEIKMFESSILTGRSSISNYSILCDLNKTHSQLDNVQQKFLNCKQRNKKIPKVRKAILTQQNTVKGYTKENNGLLNPSAKQLQEFRNYNKEFHRVYIQLIRAHRNQNQQSKEIQQEQISNEAQIKQNQHKITQLRNQIEILNNKVNEFKNDIQVEEQSWFTKLKYL